MLEFMTEQVEANRLPVEALAAMKLPEVPEDLQSKGRPVLAVSWKGRGGIPAPSALAAQKNKKGFPIAVVNMVFKSKIIEEEYSFVELGDEFPIFVEVAREQF